ncbi:DUF6970 domain-containing protein [Hymenobacter sp. NBH84]|uniref:DUF6970 domain-containing protein n=1 Tax=Hymenobacter sp. NBH84 TaxID=2596915 RepID=UPI00215623FD|nr:hypothetical protein [Hymenobacter sp. NBH84]
MKSMLALLSLSLLLVECSKDDSVPSAIQAKIAELKKNPKQNPPAVVYSYLYHGQVVYTISSDCCDQFNYLYDKDLNIICAPSGGLTGRGDGRCPDFAAAATQEHLLWRDPR